MPFCPSEISPIEISRHANDSDDTREQLFEDFTHVSAFTVVQAIRQLASLTEQASHVFDTTLRNIHEFAQRTASLEPRINEIADEISRLSCSKTKVGKSSISKYTNVPNVNWRHEERLFCSLFLPERRPERVQRLRNKHINSSKGHKARYEAYIRETGRILSASFESLTSIGSNNASIGGSQPKFSKNPAKRSMSTNRFSMRRKSRLSNLGSQDSLRQPSSPTSLGENVFNSYRPRFQPRPLSCDLLNDGFADQIPPPVHQKLVPVDLSGYPLETQVSSRRRSASFNRTSEPQLNASSDEASSGKPPKSAGKPQRTNSVLNFFKGKKQHHRPASLLGEERTSEGLLQPASADSGYSSSVKPSFSTGSLRRPLRTSTEQASGRDATSNDYDAPHDTAHPFVVRSDKWATKMLFQGKQQVANNSSEDATPPKTETEASSPRHLPTSLLPLDLSLVETVDASGAASANHVAAFNDDKFSSLPRPGMLARRGLVAAGGAEEQIPLEPDGASDHSSSPASQRRLAPAAGSNLSDRKSNSDDSMQLGETALSYQHKHRLGLERGGAEQKLTRAPDGWPDAFYNQQPQPPLEAPTSETSSRSNSRLQSDVDSSQTGSASTLVDSNPFPDSSPSPPIMFLPQMSPVFLGNGGNFYPHSLPMHHHPSPPPMGYGYPMGGGAPQGFPPQPAFNRQSSVNSNATSLSSSSRSNKQQLPSSQTRGSGSSRKVQWTDILWKPKQPAASQQQSSKSDSKHQPDISGGGSGGHPADKFKRRSSNSISSGLSLFKKKAKSETANQFNRKISDQTDSSTDYLQPVSSLSRHIPGGHIFARHEPPVLPPSLNQRSYMNFGKGAETQGAQSYEDAFHSNYNTENMSLYGEQTPHETEETQPESVANQPNEYINAAAALPVASEYSNGFPNPLDADSNVDPSSYVNSTEASELQPSSPDQVDSSTPHSVVYVNSSAELHENYANFIPKPEPEISPSATMKEAPSSHIAVVTPISTLSKAEDSSDKITKLGSEEFIAKELDNDSPRSEGSSSVTSVEIHSIPEEPDEVTGQPETEEPAANENEESKMGGSNEFPLVDDAANPIASLEAALNESSHCRYLRFNDRVEEKYRYNSSDEESLPEGSSASMRLSQITASLSKKPAKGILRKCGAPRLETFMAARDMPYDSRLSVTESVDSDTLGSSQTAIPFIDEENKPGMLTDAQAAAARSRLDPSMLASLEDTIGSPAKAQFDDDCDLDFIDDEDEEDDDNGSVVYHGVNDTGAAASAVQSN